MSEEQEYTYESSDIRCPTGAKGLMGKLVVVDGQKIEPGPHLENLLVELNCRDCTKDFRRIMADVLRVVHLYSVIGEFVNTKVQFKDGSADKRLDYETQLKIYQLASQFRPHRKGPHNA